MLTAKLLFNLQAYPSKKTVQTAREIILNFYVCDSLVLSKSVQTALLSVVLQIETALYYKKFALRNFLGISASFKNVDTCIFELVICKEWDNARTRRVVHRGTLKEGVISTLLRTLIVNWLVVELKGNAASATASSNYKPMGHQSGSCYEYRENGFGIIY